MRLDQLYQALVAFGNNDCAAFASDGQFKSLSIEGQVVKHDCR